MFDGCWDAKVLADRACQSAASRRPTGGSGKRLAASVRKRPAVAKAAPPAKRKKRERRPAAGYPPAAPMPGASRHGLVAGPKTFDKYTKGATWPCGPAGPVIRLGSDCSGLDSPKVALDLMGLGSRVECCFCSDKERACQVFLKAAHAPKILYENADKAGSAEAPEVDVYTAGFPCQPWSSEGKSKGFKDADGRGRVFDHVAKYIKEREPKSFLLENVRALTFKNHAGAFAKMLVTLRVSGRYFITWRLINCRDFGIPQNRHRVYIVGLRRDAVAASAGAGFPWPMKKRGVAPLPLRRFLCGGPGVLKTKPPVGSRAALQLHIATKTIIKERSGDPSTQPWVVECLSGREPPQCLLGIVPCITRRRAAAGGHWVTQLGRFLTVEEMLNLQGLPVPFREKARQRGLTDVQIAQMAGNAIPTNVLMLLLARVLTKLGLEGR